MLLLFIEHKVQLSNSATSTATELNIDIVSCRPHSMAHYPRDSTAEFCNPPHPLINSIFCAINQNTTRLFAVMKTQLMRKCPQYWGKTKQLHIPTLQSRALGFLNHVVPLVPMSNHYLLFACNNNLKKLLYAIIVYRT